GQGSAAALAEELQRLLSQMRTNPVRVITPTGDGGAGNQIKPTDQRQRPRDDQDETLEDEPPQGAAKPQAGGQAGAQGARQLVDPKEKKPGNPSAPVNIMAVGNRLMITSDDPQALELVSELVRLLTQQPNSKGEFEVIHLKNATASDVAKILDEAYNGARRQNQQMQFGGFPFGGRGGFGGFAAQQQQPVEDRIRVVADPATNSLLVRASPIDMLGIRRLLNTSLDVDTVDSRAVIRTWMIP